MSATSDLIQKIYIGYFGRAGDPEGLNYWVQRSSAGLSDAAIAQSFSVQDEATDMYGFLAAPSLNMGREEFLNSVYQNLFGRDMDAEGEAYWIGQLNNGRPVGGIILDIINGARNTSAGQDLTVITNKLAVANYYTEKVITANATWTVADDQADAQSVLANVTSVASTVDAGKALADTLVAADTAPAGQSFTLTTSVESFSGGAGNDTFNAANGAGTAAGQTFTTGDTLSGGAGTDTLNVVVGAANTYALSNVSGIEAVEGTFNAAGTLSLLGSSGVTSVSSNGSTAAATFTNIASTSVELQVENTDQNATFTFTTSAVSGAADSATLLASNAAGGTTVIAGVETLNIKSQGGANTITTLTTADTTKFVVTGSENLTITNALSTGVLTVDASGLTGGVIFNADQATAMTVTGGSGNDVITMTGTNAVNDSINGGAGNDRIVISANLATTDSLNGGDGTDILQSTSALLTGYTAPSTATISNFETLKVSDALGANLTTKNVQAGIATVVLDAALAANRTVTFEAGSRTVTQTATQAATLTVNDTGSAITDRLTLNIASTVGATDVLSDAVTVGGFETVNVNTTTTAAATQQMGNISITPDSGGAVVLNFLGNNKVTVGTITASSATSGTVDASGMTGSATFTNTGASGITSFIGTANNDTIVTASTSTTVDGGAGRDNITGGAGNDVLTGGAGNDTIDGAAGNDSITGGDGNDSITSGADNDTIVAGAGNDTIIYGANLATGDSIDGGDGDDTLSLTNASLTTVAAYSLSTINTLNGRISGVERAIISDALNQDANFDVSRIDSISYITLAAGITGNEGFTGLASGATVIDQAQDSLVTDILTLGLGDNTGSADSLTYVMQTSASTDHGVLSVAGIETVNIIANEETASSTVYVDTIGLTISRSDGTTTRAVTVNFSGTESITVDTAIGADTIDASAMTGVFKMTNTTGSALSQTITTGSGADSIYGGGGADTINAGSGADSVVAGTGADSITAGTGADTVDGGSGDDAIILTEGTASSDVVEIRYSNVGADLDTVTGFGTGGTNGDRIDFDISDLETAGTSGIHSSPVDFVLFGAGATSLDGTTEGNVVQRITGAATVGATTTVLLLGGATLASTDDVEDALETGGLFAIATDGNVAAGDATMVVWTDGTDGYVSALLATTADNGTAFDVGTLAVTNLVKLVGLTSIGSTTFVDGNFDFIA